MNPSNAEAHFNLGNVHKKVGNTTQAIDCFKNAILFNEYYAEAYNNLGIAYKELKKFNEALVNYEKAFDINPDIDYILAPILQIKKDLCDWTSFDSFLDHLVVKINSGKKGTSPFVLIGLVDNPSLHRKNTESWANEKYPKRNTLPKLDQYSRHKKIRLGYFSPDFREHPVSDLIAELLEIHNRYEFEIHAFSCGRDTQDKMNLRIKAGVDYFHDVYMKTDQDIAMLARSLEIDIAIDLGGYTQGARTGVFSMSAAPIQACYLGYPGTMGTDYMDYLICDRLVIPEDKRDYYTESLVYMPNSYMVNDSQIQPADKRFTRNDLNLPSEGFVFCCFNSIYKITPDVFAGWMRILNAVSDSSLWLPKSNKTAIQNLKQEAVKNGVDGNRLIFASRLELKEDHLKRIQSADLFLDTLPMNAHTTASDALRVGLPVLTRMGESFTSRVAASLLNAVNLPELITNSQEEYEALAIELATNPKKYKSLKDKLINNLPNAPLYDTPLFTRHIESAYKTMYERHREGLEPENIYVEQ
jgi:predicted O-linked N-acetylglucosamine transferase (SPINDLY family)